MNDYDATGTAAFNVRNPVPTKSVVTTSDPNTPETGAGTAASPRQATVGEVVRYRLVVNLAKGTNPNVQVQDRLPAGLTFLNDGTARLAFLSSSPMTTQFGPSANVTGSDPSPAGLPSSSLQGTFTDPEISSSPVGNVDAYGTGTDVYFNLGTVLNNDLRPTRTTPSSSSTRCWTTRSPGPTRTARRGPTTSSSASTAPSRAEPRPRPSSKWSSRSSPI